MYSLLYFVPDRHGRVNLLIDKEESVYAEASSKLVLDPTTNND